MPTSLKEKKVLVDGQEFSILNVSFDNGCFISIYEGDKKRIGEVSLALKLGERVESSIVLAGRFGAVNSSLLAEAVASFRGGIVLLSLYTSFELSSDVMRTILEELRALLSSPASC